jgi:RNA polymerase sigma-70 factor (ECF subfamily)
VRPSDDFQEFYLAGYGRTVAMAAALTGSRQEAEDIAQEAYARALARWPRLRGYDLPEAWVRRVALRLAIDSGRRARRGLLATARIPACRSANASSWCCITSSTCPSRPSPASAGCPSAR